MDLYNKIANVRGIDYEQELVAAISAVKGKLKGIDTVQMCKVYNSHLLQELSKRHVPSRLINTKDLGIDYEHIFLLVTKDSDNHFLADLTFEQFKALVPQFSQLLMQGYQPVNSQSLNEYLNIISRTPVTKQFSSEELFYKM